MDVSVEALKTIREFHPDILDDYLYLLVPMLLRICSSGITSLETQLNTEALLTISSLRFCYTFREHVA